MSKVICIASTKGGVGKTTVSILLLLGSLQESKKVLAVDFDPNIGLSRSFMATQEKTLWQNPLNFEDLIQKESINDYYFDLIPQARDNQGRMLKNEYLHSFFSWARNNYDVIILDSQPNELLLQIPMQYADLIIVPTFLDWLSIESSAWTFQIAHKNNIPIGGVVVNNIKKPISKLSETLLEGLRIMEITYKTTIPYRNNLVALISQTGNKANKQTLDLASQLFNEINNRIPLNEVTVDSFMELSKS